MKETWVQSLGLEDPLEEDLATHSSILAWRILWTEEPGELQSMELKRGGHDLMTKQQLYMCVCIYIYIYINLKYMYIYMCVCVYIYIYIYIYVFD